MSRGSIWGEEDTKYCIWAKCHLGRTLLYNPINVTYGETQPTQVMTTEHECVMPRSLVPSLNCNVKPKLTGSNLYNVTQP